MRKWSFILFCLTALAGLIVLVGCEGDTGTTGAKGSKGRQGTSGYDPDRLPPADRPFAFGVTNKTESSVSGRKQIYLSFDSTARGTKDTVVANHVSVPPLIDGKDDEDFEWGPQKSKLSNMAFINPDPGVLDCQMSRATVRAAYDNENIYMLFQWTETAFLAKVSQPDGSVDTVAVEMTESKKPDQLRFKGFGFSGIAKDSVSYYTAKGCSLKVKPDTIWTYMRTTHRDSCITPFGGQCLCYRTVSGKDTGWVWIHGDGGAEDRLVVFFPDAPVDGWQDAAFKQFFNFATGDPNYPSNLMVDVWAWGSATTRPVATADDWSISASGCKPDVGEAPFIFNYSAADSAPVYQNRRDPNFGSDSIRQPPEIYPLWYFDAVGFSWTGWTRNYLCNVPGIVTTIPSESRADVYAAATFDNGVWTVEMKRARKTNHGDDVQF